MGAIFSLIDSYFQKNLLIFTVTFKKSLVKKQPLPLRKILLAVSIFFLVSNNDYGYTANNIYATALYKETRTSLTMNCVYPTSCVNENIPLRKTLLKTAAKTISALVRSFSRLLRSKRSCCASANVNEKRSLIIRNYPWLAARCQRHTILLIRCLIRGNRCSPGGKLI